MTELENDGLPPWPEIPEGWDFDPSAMLPRRTSTLFVGALVFVQTDRRVYRKRWNGRWHEGHGGPVYRYQFEVRRVAGETSRSWLLQEYSTQHVDHWSKVPKRDLSMIYGHDDVEDELWTAANQGKISRAVGDLKGPSALIKLQAIAQVIGFEP